MASYLTQAGDPTNLQGLATKLNIPVGTLLSANPNLANSDFSAGTNVNLPASNTSATNVATPAKPTATPATPPTTAPQPAKPQAPAITSGSSTGTQNQPAGNIQSQVDAINKQALEIQKQLKSLPADQLNDGGAVRASAADTITPPDTSTKAQDQLVQLENLLQQKINDFANPQSQTFSLQDYYNQQAQAQGLPALDQKVIDLENVMNGTEQDIRNEVSAGGGFADESQVQALVASRNKVLTTQLNSLLNLQKYKQDWINNQVQLKQTDVNTASANFDKLFGYQEKIATLQNTIDNSGFKNTLAYQAFQQKQQTAALNMMTQLNKQGALGNLDAQTLQWLSDSTGIPSNLIQSAGTNAAQATALKLATIDAKLKQNQGFGGVDNMAQAVINGLLAPSQLPGFGINSLRTQVLNKVYSIDPSFDTRQADASFAFQKSQKSNLIQASIASANAAVPIIEDLSSKVDRGDIQPINAAELLFKSKSGDVNTAKFLAAVKIVGDEYGAVFGQGAATDFKAQLGLSVVDPTFSAAQFKGMLEGTVLPLMQARLQAIQNQGTGGDVTGDVANTATSNPTPTAADQSYLNSLPLPK